MANLKAPLSVKEVEQLKSEGSHAVGGVPGLLLQVTSGGRSWIYRYTFEGLRKKIGLGPYSALSLRDAREQAQEFALRIRAGVEHYRSVDSLGILLRAGAINAAMHDAGQEFGRRFAHPRNPRGKSNSGMVI